MYDAIVSIGTVVVLIPLVLILAYYVLALVTRGPDRFFGKVRYEAANPPKGTPRPPVLYQYLGYVIAFVVLDPIFMPLFTLPTVAKSWDLAWIGLNIAAGIIVVPPLFYAIRYASRKELWSFD